MFSTCLAVLDGYGRSFKKCVEIIIPESKSEKSYNYAIITVVLGAFALVYYFLDFSNNPKGFKTLIDLATAISFVVAPIIAIAIANFRLVSEKYITKEFTPSLFLKILSVLGVIFLTVFSIIYIISIV